MVKYSKEFKLKVVKAYINGEGSSPTLAKKYGVKSYSNIERWVTLYNYFGEHGLEKQKKNNNYSTQFKLDVLQYRKDNDYSLMEICIKFKVSDSSLIIAWEKKLSSGEPSNIFRKKGRPPMKKIISKNPSNQKKQSDKLKTLYLEEELEKAKLENLYLKKLKAYLENQNDSSQRHKSK